MGTRFLIQIKTIVRRSRLLNIIPRLFVALSYFQSKPSQIFVWLFSSKEDTNFTYELTEKNILELALMISIVTQVDHDQILSYINEIRNDTKLKQFIRNRVRQSAYSSVADENVFFCKRIGWYAIARAMKPKCIVETGVDQGLGSIVLCSALLKNREEGKPGKYIGTDINPAAGYLLTGKYATVGKLMIDDSITSLRTIDSPIDLFINDSDHSGDYEAREYQTIHKKLSKRAVILGDNAHVTDKLLQFSVENKRNFLFFREEPKGHWYPGAGIGISFKL